MRPDRISAGIAPPWGAGLHSGLFRFRVRPGSITYSHHIHGSGKRPDGRRLGPAGARAKWWAARRPSAGRSGARCIDAGAAPCESNRRYQQPEANWTSWWKRRECDRRPGTKATFLNGGHKEDLKWQAESPGIELRWQASPMLRVW